MSESACGSLIVITVGSACFAFSIYKGNSAEALTCVSVITLGFHYLLKK